MSQFQDAPIPVFDHLDRLSDERGLFEHALLSEPRPEHGYCVDDTARGLVVLSREPHPSPRVHKLQCRYLDFVLSAIEPSGKCHNRMAVDGSWRDDAALGDWWGRALWGLGVASPALSAAGMRARAVTGFRLAAQCRSPHVRAMTFAALGAAELLRSRPDECAAKDLLRDAVEVITAAGSVAGWPWPEERLTYGNGAIPEALIVAGDVLGDEQVLDRGLALLEFLMSVEIREGHLSVTPCGGRGLSDVGPGYDQQPIEVAALADACASAYRITHEARWLVGIKLAWSWFLGDNDSRTPMFDPATGGGFDGLEPNGHNLNQGAESTLAMLSTAQHARRFGHLT